MALSDGGKLYRTELEIVLCREPIVLWLYCAGSSESCSTFLLPDCCTHVPGTTLFLYVCFEWMCTTKHKKILIFHFLSHHLNPFCLRTDCPAMVWLSVQFLNNTFPMDFTESYSQSDISSMNKCIMLLSINLTVYLFIEVFLFI